MNKQDLIELNQKQEKFFHSGKTLDVRFRLESLRTIKSLINKYENKLFEALREDLGKSPFESYASETGMTIQEINLILRNLKRWARPRKAYTPLVHFIAKSYYQYEPFGRVLIISPWNYPFQLLMVPLIGAVSAGNCILAKPSRHAVHTTTVLQEMMNEAFNPEYIHILRGSKEVNESLLYEKYDYIFFTGSTHVATHVMKSASHTLTPISLELGGKNPTIVTKDANIKLAAKRILWGKLLNGGQSCVATDYVLVHAEMKSELIEEMKKYLHKSYGNDPEQSEDFCRIINKENTERIKNYIDPDKIITGGKVDVEKRYVAPTIIDEPELDKPIMHEEIFGPVLPVIGYTDLDEAIQMIVDRPKPLALYIFSTSKNNQQKIIRKTQSGTLCINETVVHFINPYLPFGGIGKSGMGRYHGKFSFETFSYKRPVLKKSNLIDIPVRYPPYSKNKLRVIRYFVR